LIPREIATNSVKLNEIGQSHPAQQLVYKLN